MSKRRQENRLLVSAKPPKQPRLMLTAVLKKGIMIREVIEVLITKEMLEEVQEKVKNSPPMTPEEKAKLQALGEKMRSLSYEERKVLRMEFEKEHGII